MGSIATKKDSAKLSPTGVNNWWNILFSPFAVNRAGIALPESYSSGADSVIAK
jgi:hypothetical protein